MAEFDAVVDSVQAGGWREGVNRMAEGEECGAPLDGLGDWEVGVLRMEAKEIGEGCFRLGADATEANRSGQDFFAPQWVLCVGLGEAVLDDAEQFGDRGWAFFGEAWNQFG